MLKALQKGNTYPVEMERNGKGEIMFVEASPKFKSINVYDPSMSLFKNTDLLIDGKKQGKGMEPEPEESKKKDMKKGEEQTGVDDGPLQAAKKARSRPKI